MPRSPLETMASLIPITSPFLMSSMTCGVLIITSRARFHLSPVLQAINWLIHHMRSLVIACWQPSVSITGDGSGLRIALPSGIVLSS